MTGNTPVGRIVTRGEPLRKDEKTLTAPAKAGMLVEIDSDDYKVKPATGTLKPFGWVSYEHTLYEYRPDDYETPYEANDIVSVVSGGDFEIHALATGEGSAGNDWAIHIGDLLISNEDGTLTKYTDAVVSSKAPELPVAIALESMTIAKAATPNVVRIKVRSLI